MPRITKAQRETDSFRQRVSALLAEPDDWEDYEHVRRWLQKLLHPNHSNDYSTAERAAVARVIAARSRLFDGWDGYNVPELLTAALGYVADFSYEDEVFLKEREARAATRLRLGDMGHLVSLCRMAGVDLQRFTPEIEAYDEAT